MLRILVLNFGGTSAKVAVYEDDKCIHNYSMPYSEEEVRLSLPAKEELNLKKNRILEWLESVGLQIKDLDAFAVRLGGLFYGGDGGTFLVEGDLRKHVESLYNPEKPLTHATEITFVLVNELQKDLKVKKPSYATDPTTINQFLPEARITGHPLFTKRIAFHALNQRAAARKAAADLNKTYKDVNLIVVHAGGGVSVGAHEKGRIIDVNDSSGDGDGPFAPNRAGTLPTGQLVNLCYSGKYSKVEAFRVLKGESGLKAYLGTEDLREVEKRIDNGDEHAELIFKAMAYQISREIGACYATLCGEVDAIVMTAGMSHSDRLVDLVSKRVEKIAPVLCYPGEFENEALALGAYRVMSGQEKPTEYQGEGSNVQAISPY